MPTLWLVGMMGSGKSTVAPLVAERLGVDCTDTDDEVARSGGRSIEELLRESESEFRRLEWRVISAIAGSEQVVACGGGVVTIPEAVERMRESGVVIWLRTPFDVLARRVRADDAVRPLLGRDVEAGLMTIGERRAGLYERAAHLVVETGDREPDEVADEVVRAWKSASSEA